VTKASINDLTAPIKEAKSFDAWFFAQPKKVQEKLRESGVLPYREMVQSRHVFCIDANHPKWAFNPTTDEHRTEVDSFISRDHVGVMLGAFMDAIAHSDSMQFRRHVELVRWALSLPGCLDSRTIARMYGRSHIWAQKRARQIRSSVNGDACGLFPPHINSRRDKHKQRRSVSK
jgi:hypothetical protein